jgi:hypothetical protein
MCLRLITPRAMLILPLLQFLCLRVVLFTLRALLSMPQFLLFVLFAMLKKLRAALIALRAMLNHLQALLNHLRRALNALRAMLFVLQPPRYVLRTHLFALRLTCCGLSIACKLHSRNAHKKKFYKPICLCCAWVTGFGDTRKKKCARIVCLFCPSYYYSLEVFSSVKKMDTHIHINSDSTAFEEQAKGDNFLLLGISVDVKGYPNITKQQRLALLPIALLCIFEMYPNELALSAQF